MSGLRAEEIYVGVLLALVAMLLWGGACDLYLWLSDEQTISTFLRANPRFYFVPLVGILVFIAGLTIHLFLTGK